MIMIKKTVEEKEIDEIRTALKKNKIIIGSNQTIKLLKLGKMESIFITKNCPEYIKADLRNYCTLNKTRLVEISYPNKELGIICKKQHAISVVSIPKGA